MQNGRAPILSGTPSRRAFLRGSTAAATIALLGARRATAADTGGSDEAGLEEISLPLTREGRDALSPEAVLEELTAGNERFRSGQMRRRDFMSEVERTAAGQYPAAVLLSCIDSRAPAEIIFDVGIGNLFNCRIAGNIDNPDILGSIEFAAKVAGAKVVLVLGHSACGAVRGAVAGAKLGNLTQLLGKFHPAIDATDYTGERTGENIEFVDTVARTNVALTVKNIRSRSEVVAELEEAKALKLVGGFYDLSTGKVEIMA